MNQTPSRWFDSAWRVTAVYTLVTLATTWPLAAHLTTSLPADFGDPLLNSFILQWGTGEAVPEVYRFAATLPSSTVLLEYPLGAPAWDLQSVFYQPVHRHPLVNGYSGGFPKSFYDNTDAFTTATPFATARSTSSSDG